MKYFSHIPFLLCMLPGLMVQAQNETELYDEIVVPYHHQWYGGATVHSNGLGANVTYAQYRDVKNLRMFGFEVVFMKHEKEIRRWNPLAQQDSRSYIFGKTNNLYILRPYIGKKHIISEKLRRSGVQFAYNWSAGPAIGITKPVYLTIGYPEPFNPDYFLSEKFDPDKHYIDNIYGRASSLLGLDELKIHPGGFAKFSLTFEYSSEMERLKSLEVGMVADVFGSRIPIMSQAILDELEDGARNHQVFLTLFLSLSFGKKYTD